MKKEVRCFISNRYIATPDSTTVSPVFELSVIGRTYAKRVIGMTIPDDNENFLQCFQHNGETDNELTPEEGKLITTIVWGFIESLKGVIIEDKDRIIANFTKHYNSKTQVKLEAFNYNSLVQYDNNKYADYVTFSIDNLECSVWLTNETFTVFYPLYEINVIPPFPEFPDIVKCAPEMLEALGNFKLTEFVNSLNDYNEGYPPTVNTALNIHYRAEWNSKLNDCYFGFNVYGVAGVDDFILKDAVYDYLSKDLGLTDEFIEEHFPTLFEVNEFFMLPDWESYALPFKAGQGSINSHMSSTYAETYPIMSYAKVYDGFEDFVKASTTNLPIRYNNILVRVIDGRHSAEGVKEFRKYYPDFIDVNTESQDFSRMSPRTQKFSLFLKNLINVCDADNQSELLNKIMNQKLPGEGTTRVPTVRVTPRKGVVYVSATHGLHRYYMIPRYEHERITKEEGL